MERNRILARKIKEKINRCVNCGSKDELETHHIVALTNGGKDVESNITVLCHDCHCKAHSKVNKGYSKPNGRKPKVPYEKACEYIEQYLNCEITIPKLKSLLRVGEKSQSSINDIRSFKRYIKENNVSKETIEKARQHSKSILLG